MGDLSRYAIDELTPQEKHEVLKILEDLRRTVVGFYTFFYTAGRYRLVRSGTDR